MNDSDQSSQMMLQSSTACGYSLDCNNECFRLRCFFEAIPGHDEVVLDGSPVEVSKLFPECWFIVHYLVSHVTYGPIKEGAHHVGRKTWERKDRNRDRS